MNTEHEKHACTHYHNFVLHRTIDISSLTDVAGVQLRVPDGQLRVLRGRRARPRGVHARDQRNLSQVRKDLTFTPKRKQTHVADLRSESVTLD